jgi:hypothetical protein
LGFPCSLEILRKWKIVEGSGKKWKEVEGAEVLAHQLS